MKNRVGRETGNTHIFFLPNEAYTYIMYRYIERNQSEKHASEVMYTMCISLIFSVPWRTHEAVMCILWLHYVPATLVNIMKFLWYMYELTPPPQKKPVHLSPGEHLSLIAASETR